MKGILKHKTSRNRFFPFIIATLLLLFLSLQLPINQIPMANAEPQQKSAEIYPETPEGVVEAFVKAGLDNEWDKAQNKYLPDDEDLKFNRKTHAIDLSKYQHVGWGIFLGKYHITIGYEIKETKMGKNKATVKVLYKRLGWIWDTPVHIKECRSLQTAKDKQEADNLLEAAKKLVYKQKGWVWDKEGCKFLHITNDTDEVTYHLAKPGKFWRVTDPYEPHISVGSGIRQLEEINRHDVPARKTNPSEKQKIEIEKAIKILENHLKDENKGR